MQAQTLKKQFESLDLSKLPKEVIEEAMEIRDNTDNFSDQDLVDVFLENWTLLYDDVIKGQYPSAIPDEASQAPDAPKKPKYASPKKKAPPQKTTPWKVHWKDVEARDFYWNKTKVDVMKRTFPTGKVEYMVRGNRDFNATKSETPEAALSEFNSIVEAGVKTLPKEMPVKSILFGDMGGNTTVFTNAFENPVTKDYWQLASIKKDGTVDFRVPSKFLPKSVVNKIEAMAKKEKKPVPKKKPAPKKAPAAKKKAPAKKKRTTKTPAIRKKDLMRYFDEELRIIKRFYNMLNKEVPRKRWISLHRFIQKALVDKRAHPNSKLADLVKTVAKKAENVTDQATQDMVKVTLDDQKLTARIAELAKQTAVYPSVRLFKRYIQLSGERAPDEKIDRLIQAIEKAIATKKVHKKDPFGKELEDVLKMLKKARDNGRVEAMNVGLGAPNSGLAGAMDYAVGKN